MRRSRLFAAIGVAGLTVAGCHHQQAMYGGGSGGTYIDHGKAFLLQLLAYLAAAGLGFVIGHALSEKYADARRLIWRGLGILIVVVSFFIPDNLIAIRGFLTVVICVALFVIAWGIGHALGLLDPDAPRTSNTFGSARWMTATALRESPLGLIGQAGLVLGYFKDGVTPLQYTGDRHLLTVAPTRAGKGVSAIIPNLLSYTGSALVIDPKGENAMITALRRGKGDETIPGLGQDVHVVDPWGITGLPSARFNPVEWLVDPANLELGENALMLADSLVPPSSGNENPFWDEEARSLIMGIMLHVATSPTETNRTLGRVRDLLQLGPQEFDDLSVAMSESANPIVAATGRRTAGKHETLMSSVLAVAQSHTHFLDSPALRDSLSRSNFRFEDLKERPTTIYLVLPSDRLHTFGRWLRLLIQQAITVNARNVATRPDKPILFMLDEMASLGRLTMVQQAYGLMAGFGMQMWGIVQDLSQLNTIYGAGWQTFVSNSGVLQYFGSRDKETAEYFSDLCGSQTVATFSSTISKALTPGDAASGGESTSHSHGETSRKLIMADELMRFPTGVQLLLVENADPIDGRKAIWFSNERFRSFGKPLRQA